MLLAAPVVAIDEEAEIQQAIDAYEERSWELGVAAGYGVRTNPLVNSDDIPMYAVLNMAWFGDYFFFDNGDIGITAYETEKLSVNVIGHINNEREIFEWLNDARLGIQFSGVTTSSLKEGFETTNTNVAVGDGPVDLDALKQSPETGKFIIKPLEPTKRSLAFDAGIELMYADTWGDLQLQVLGDVTYTHKGVDIWASYAYPWRHGSWSVVPSVGVKWKSSHLLDYYYGVRNSEAVGERHAYKASSGFNTFAKLSASYRIDENWGVVGVAEYESLSRSIRRSPIVDEQGIATLFIGVMYNF